MAELFLTTGERVLVDEDDLGWLSEYRWYRLKTANPHHVYAQTNVWTVEGWRCGVRMHRLIMGEPDDMIDHINGDRLDNRRSNLRLATHGQNMVNRAGFGQSGRRGVWKNGNKWAARGAKDGVKHYLGTYNTIEEAGDVYDAWAREHHGEYVYANSLPEDDLAAVELLRAIKRKREEG